MLFSSVTFIFYFLPLVLNIYYFSKDKMKNYILLFFSLIFYAWGGVAYLPILLMSILINYILGLKIDKYKESNKKQKIILILAIIFNIAFFKAILFSVLTVWSVFKRVPSMSVQISLIVIIITSIS